MRSHLVLATLLIATGAAGAAEIKALITTAMKAAIDRARAAVRARNRPQGDVELRPVRRASPTAAQAASSPT